MKIDTLRKVLAYKLTPVNTIEKKIVFTSFDGHFSDSPKYIAEAIHALAPDIKIVWLIQPKYSDLIPDYAEWYDINSIEAQKQRGQAVAIVDNVYCDRAFDIRKGHLRTRIQNEIMAVMKSKSSQPAFTTFHGTAIKCMARDQVGNEDIVGFISYNMELFMGNEYNSRIFRHLTFNKIKVSTMGTPRNDILINTERTSCLRKQLGLPEDKKVALFAPTFRSDSKINDINISKSGLDQLSAIDFEKLFSTLTHKFGGDWVFVCRFHYHVEEKVDWDCLSAQYGGRIINGNKWDNMADYLVCADMLLTDASSCCMDYAITKKPCFLFFPDYQNYKNSERGYYIDPKDLPFPLALDFPALIERMNAFDYKQYEKELDEMMIKLGYMEDGNSSSRIAEYILEKLSLNGEYTK